jgi:Phosphatidylinositol-specific phospholipase C, X domain
MTLKLPALLTALLFSASTFSVSVLAEPHDAPSQWMGRLDEGKYLSELSIPGSHDSGSTEGGRFYADQTLSITEQLTVGVRFLDVRLVVNPQDRATLQVAHGSGLTQQLEKINFRDVIKDCIAFLIAHPTETVIMSVKEEDNYSAERFEGLIYDEIKSSLPKGEFVKDRFWLNDWIPTLKQARHKIVLIRRFEHHATTVPLPFGMDATGWDKAMVRNMDIEDRYKILEDKDGISHEQIKLNSVEDHIQKAVSSPNPLLFITFTSAYGHLDPRDRNDKTSLTLNPITDYTDTINPALPRFLAQFSSSRVGIVPMDFVDANLSWAVIKTNF